MPCGYVTLTNVINEPPPRVMELIGVNIVCMSCYRVANKW